ncbi:hypothetical protein F4778DRAFT_749827 [Xylariomycetidae sp. FL2044]|nr:hypothetical protein F4778DRAFT_749827 [Xylariomycetidae sp. FL2044]
MAAACKVCEEPLMLEVDDDEEGNSQSVPDDLELQCGCHFHWQCLLDASSEVAISLKCPSCGSPLAANAAGPSVTNPFLHTPAGVRILARYANEGGTQEDLDILPAITEEAYLDSNPEARPARAYHVMCTEGDVGGIVELLRDAEQQPAGGEPAMNVSQLLRYQDPLANMKSGLHLAVGKGQEEVVWLLLWLASPLRNDRFPEPALQTAQALGLQRPATSASDDIRELRDDRGRTAETVAAEFRGGGGGGGNWAVMVQDGILRPMTT